MVWLPLDKCFLRIALNDRNRIQNDYRRSKGNGNGFIALLILQDLHENIGNYTQKFYVFFPHLLFSALSL